MEKCKRKKRQLCVSKNWIFSWLWKSSKSRQQYCRLESFAIKTGGFGCAQCSCSFTWRLKLRDLSSYSNDPVVPCKNKTSQEPQRSLQKVLEPVRKPEVIYTDNSLEFGKTCEDLSWNHCTSTPHRSETKWDCWKSSAQSKGRHLCCIVAIGSESKLVGRFYGMLHLSAKRHRFTIWQPFQGPNVPCTRCEFGRVTWWSQTLSEELETMDATEINSKRLNAKEVIFPTEK